MFDYSGFHRSLDEERRSRGLTWADVAAQSHVSMSTIRRLRNPRGPVEGDGVLFLLAWRDRTPLRRFDTRRMAVLLAEAGVTSIRVPPGGRTSWDVALRVADALGIEIDALTRPA